MAIAAALLMVLAPVGLALHEHDAGSEHDGHADCDACHFRVLSVIAADGAPAPIAPELVAHTVVPAPAAGRLHLALGLRPTRGPPA
ncbi:MAG: hypothetical protein F4W89_04510 [Acidobacteria bacterium]|nr:hypothetical protein [Acidobacteriota bacterium]MYJ05391.1 hypothetical protein [Acidobacteriota bacterium]